MFPANPTTFGDLLKQLRKRAGLTQSELAAAVGYSVPFISNLELNQRLPDVAMVAQCFVPALGLQDDPVLRVRLIEQAAAARGERPPAPPVVAPMTAAAAPVAAGYPCQVPTLPTAVIGRTADLAQISNRLVEHTGRLLTLVGPPGVGKTTLALAVATHLRLHYPDGVVFVSLAPINDATAMAMTILAAVGGPDASPKPPTTRLIALLRRKKMLLVLDNVEQIGEAASLIGELLGACPQLCILATSRERLHLRAEQRYRVPPLELDAAVELFRARAEAVGVDFALTPTNQPTIAAICQRLDCLPLALELCAVQLDLFSPAQLLGQLQTHSLTLLTNGTHDLPPHHRTLRAAIARSYALLSAEERALFCTLGLFAGGFALPELAMVMAASGEAESLSQDKDAFPPSLLTNLHALVSKSLVRSETTTVGDQRFFLLETIREFAAEQLAQRGDLAVLRQRHFAAYLQLARTVDDQVRGAKAALWFERLSQEHDNLRAAWQWAITSQNFVDAAWFAVALCHSWHVRAYWHEGVHWLEQLLPHRHELTANLHLALLLTLFRFWRASHNFPAIDQHRDEVNQLGATCPARLLRAAAWFYQGVSLADPAQSIVAFDHALRLLRTSDLAPDLSNEFCYFADSINLQAMVLVRYAIRLTDEIGDYERAEQLTRESLRLFRQRANRDFVAYAIGNLGRLALVRGDIAQAHQQLQEAVALATAVGNRMSLADWQPRLGIVTLYGGNAPEARRLLAESLALCLPLGNAEYLARIYGYLAEVALCEAKLDEAEGWMGQSAAYQPSLLWHMIEEVDFLYVCARLGAAQQRYGEAARRFGLAEQVAQRIGYGGAGPMRPQIEAALTTVRAALDATVFAKAFASGEQLSLADAFAKLATATRPHTA